jgi:hypothetical protein
MKWADFGRKLQSVKRETLYLLLILSIILPLVFTFEVPNKPQSFSIDAYQILTSVPEGSTVLIESDWSQSSRGDSGGTFEAVIKILMQRGVKFAVYSATDVQSSQVARDTVERLVSQRKAAGLPEYKRWRDWVSVGFFPDANANLIAMRTDIRRAFAGRKDIDESGQQRDVFQSPVLEKITRINDASLFIVLTASRTSNSVVERLGTTDLTLMASVTGVMGPETLPYYTSGQFKAIMIGVRGAYDLETMMEKGVNYPDAQTAYVKSPRHPTIPPIEGLTKEYIRGLGARYYATLHVALGLMILAVVAGNVGMFLTKRGGRAS